MGGREGREGEGREGKGTERDRGQGRKQAERVGEMTKDEERD